MIKSTAFPSRTTEIKTSIFKSDNGVDEYNIFIRPSSYSSVEKQLAEINESYRLTLNELGIDSDTSIFRRFFCSDLNNQAIRFEQFDITSSQKSNCAVSFICQPPMMPAKISMWAYHISDPSGIEKSWQDNSLKLQRKDHVHHWTTNLCAFAGQNSYYQTEGIFSKYNSYLDANELTLSDNVVRTWFFVQNVDVNYKGFVEARNDIFKEAGLTKETHYIASTGIEGRHVNPQHNTAMDSYAISNIRHEQLEFLSVPENMCPTHDYGVSFERATTVKYRDRKHTFISGTASIDKKGQVVHKGDVLKQLDRTVENVQALLDKCGSKLSDIASAIVYIRDISDFSIIKENISKYLGGTPHEIVLAPVCRPEWLIEIEAIAITKSNSPEMPEL
ncbi:MAG: Rid family hydrolase [Sedimentisphaeraceae bacterium JB056]